MIGEVLYTKMVELSKEKGIQITNKQFAHYLQMSTADLSRLLNNKRKPSMPVAKKIYAKYPDLAPVLLGE